MSLDRYSAAEGLRRIVFCRSVNGKRFPPGQGTQPERVGPQDILTGVRKRRFVPGGQMCNDGKGTAARRGGIRCLPDRCRTHGEQPGTGQRNEQPIHGGGCGNAGERRQIVADSFHARQNGRQNAVFPDRSFPFGSAPHGRGLGKPDQGGGILRTDQQEPVTLGQRASLPVGVAKAQVQGEPSAP